MKLPELLDWYENLSPDDLHEVHRLYHEEARFIDPFNNVQGPAAIERIFKHMFESTEQPRFIVQYHLQHENLAWVQWKFVFQLNGRKIDIDGSSELHFAEDGRVYLHKDFWDASVLMQELPWVGKIIYWIRTRLRTPQMKISEN